MAQLLIPNQIYNNKDECRGAADACVVERVVLEAQLPDGHEPLRLVLLFFRDFRIGDNALGDDEGLFIRLKVVGGRGDDDPNIVLSMGFVVASLEEDGSEGLVEAYNFVAGGLTQYWLKGLCGLRQEKRELFGRHDTAKKRTAIG